MQPQTGFAALTFVFLLALLLYIVVYFMPAVSYFLRYSRRFNRRNNNAGADYAAEIPYDRYLYPMTLEQAKKMAIVPVIYRASEYANTQSNPIQQAIDDAHLHGGGIVVVDMSATVDHLVLKDNICLFIPAEVTVTVTGYLTDKKTFRFIESQDAKNICITGGGKIKGTGKSFWREPDLVTIFTPVRKYDIRVLKYIHFAQKYYRSEGVSIRFVVFNGCGNICIDNIVFEDAPGWSLSLEASHDIRVANCVFNSNYHGANTDGIDISGTSDVLVEDCYLSVGDDAICLKNDKQIAGRESTDMKNIRARNCFIRTATNGFKIGTGVYHNISDVHVSGLTMEVKGVYPPTICGITIVVSEGGMVNNVVIENVNILNALAPVFLRVSNRNLSLDKSMTGSIRHVSLSNITAHNIELPIIVAGVADAGAVAYIEDVSLKNIDVTYRDARQAGRVNKIKHRHVKEAATEYPETWMMGEVPAHGVYLRHAKNITVEGCSFTPRRADKRPQIAKYDVDGK